MIVGERAAANLGQLENLNAAKRALLRGEPAAHVYDRHKWFVDKNGLMKTVLSNKDVKITPPPRGKRVPITDVIKHDLFYKAVPGARNWTTSVRPLPGGTRGAAIPMMRHIILTPEAARGSSTYLHELAHAGQKEQGLPLNNRGSTPARSGGFMKYRNNLGEVEARMSGANAPPSAKAHALIERTRASGVRKPVIKPPLAAKPPDSAKRLVTPTAVKGKTSMSEKPASNPPPVTKPPEGSAPIAGKPAVTPPAAGNSGQTVTPPTTKGSAPMANKPEQKGLLGAKPGSSTMKKKLDAFKRYQSKELKAVGSDLARVAKNPVRSVRQALAGPKPAPAKKPVSSPTPPTSRRPG